MKKYFTTTAIISCCLAFSQDYSVSSISSELKKNANTVIRQNSTQYNINKVDNLEIKEKEVKTILNKAGESNSAITIYYDNHRKVSNIKVRIFDEFGKVIRTYYKKDFEDMNGTGSSGLYSDNRVLHLAVTSLSFPYTIEATYDITTSDTAFIPSFRPFYESNVSVEKIDLNIINKSGLNLRHKIVDSKLAKVIQSGSGNDLTFSYANVTAVKDEKYAPSIDLLSPKVEFSLEKFSLAGKLGDISDWQSFGKWYNNLLEPVSIVTPEIQKEVDALQLSGPVSEKVKKLYQYMQDKTRYVNVFIGIGGWQPSPADDVRRKGYGDCKGLTNYMRVLLKAAGIPAYYAIIYSNFTPRLFDADFPRMDGNHAILMVPTEIGNVWLENTSQKIAFNHIGYSNSNRNVMLVKDDGIELVNTPVYKDGDSNEILKAKVNILENLSLTGTANFNYTGGMYDFKYYTGGLSKDDLKDNIKTQYSNLKFQDITINKAKNDRDEGIVDLDLDFIADNYSKKMNNDIFFTVLPFNQNSFYLDDNDERTLPVEIPFAYNDNYEIEFTLPKGYKLSEIPQSIALDSNYGQYHLNIESLGDKVIVKRKLNIKKDYIAQEDIKKYTAFRKKIAKYDNTKLLITQN